jgi:hypothetical protein
MYLVSLKGWSHEIKWSFDDYTAYLRTFLPSAAGFYIKKFLISFSNLKSIVFAVSFIARSLTRELGCQAKLRKM